MNNISGRLICELTCLREEEMGAGHYYLTVKRQFIFGVGRSTLM